jgi:hypothetical protein
VLYERAISVSNSVLNFQYRGRYNTGISKMSIPVLAGIEVFSRNIPLPLKKWEMGCPALGIWVGFLKQPALPGKAPQKKNSSKKF